ncbi:MAG: M1 family peptidase, partial [Deltaproteobacteria bacterium]|nr:M1 family peptidase [Deltaproteobacteria bacterium]
VAPYVVETKPVGKITATTYLLPPNKHLATSYLEATARYIALYSDLFGPYPFQKFAVVENFFPTGYGFPSYTLMGGSVLRLPFIVHTSLGHEIAHCWWGNGVYADYAAGNWSEGLTAYVADYLFKEMKSPEDARDYRRQWLRNFATLVRPDTDMALDQFRSRYSPVSKTIGYDKAAMVFHMIRQIIGEDAFWGALRDVYRERVFQQTSWSDLQHAFESRGQVSLQDFFHQWVFRKGAPQFRIDAVMAEPSAGIWKVRGRIIQNRPYYKFPLVFALKTRQKTLAPKIEVSGHTTSFEWMCDDAPLKLAADPDYDLFRRLYPTEIPPAVNAFKSSPSVVTVLSGNLDTEMEKVARTLVLSLGLKNNEFVTEDKLSQRKLVENDILLIGQPQRKDLLQNMPNQVSVQPGSFTLNGSLHSQASDAFFGVFHHPVNDHRIAALFIPSSDQFADSVARKITHYGKYSYLSFQLGKNTAKGTWPVEKSPLLHEWNHDM